MFGKEDKTYDSLRENSVNQWLEDMLGHEDVTVRGGVQVTRDYIESLRKKIEFLESKNTLKDEYLKKLKG